MIEAERNRGLPWRLAVLGMAVLSAAVSALAGSGPPTPRAVRDPGGCWLEPVAIESDVDAWQTDGLSWDGRTIAVGWNRGETSRGTYLLDLETGERTEVPELNHGATFSPDGEMLASAVYLESGKTDILELDRTTRAVRAIAPHPDWDFLPSYSPDGSWIAFNSYRTGNSDIYLFDRATGELRRMTDSETYDAHAKFSPDGGTIVFHRQVSEADFDIFLLDTQSGEETRITRSPHEESYPSWMPDGRHIVFSSDRDNDPGKTDLFVMGRTGRVVARLTRHPEKDAYAFASRDGGYVYFNSDREPKGVYRMAVDEEMRCRSDDPSASAPPAELDSTE